jgi:hypothetical protein
VYARAVPAPPQASGIVGRVLSPLLLLTATLAPATPTPGLPLSESSCVRVQVGNVLQYPCELSPKWTTLCIDLVEILQRCKKSGFKCLKAVQVPLLHTRHSPGVSFGVVCGGTLIALASRD